VDSLKMNDLTNLELLRLATELAYADYNNRRANLHNQWLVDNDKMKRMYNSSVPYPTIPPYPTEAEIVAKAKTLIQFLSVPRPQTENTETQLEIKQFISEVRDNKDKQNTTLLKNDRDMVIEQKENPTPTNISIEENNTEKTSVIDKIKKVWR
jgi:hypothetical protein